MVRDSLFENLKLTKNAHPEKYSYSGCEITFDKRGTFLLRNGGFAKNEILDGADMRSFCACW